MTAILKWFAELEQTPAVPGPDPPGLDAASMANRYGCDALLVDDLDAMKQAAWEAWTKDVPTVLKVPFSRAIPPLI